MIISDGISFILVNKHCYNTVADENHLNELDKNKYEEAFFVTMVRTCRLMNNIKNMS